VLNEAPGLVHYTNREPSIGVERRVDSMEHVERSGSMSIGNARIASNSTSVDTQIPQLIDTSNPAIN
jgi:hypothetical protein